jgi:hypothetical protein
MGDLTEGKIQGLRSRYCIIADIGMWVATDKTAKVPCP